MIILRSDENGSELFDELSAIQKKATWDGIEKLSPDEKKRYNDICDVFISKGVSEDVIEKALGE